jgi:predicted nucleic acid-binding protein
MLILNGVSRIYLDAAPVIYFIEDKGDCKQATNFIFDLLDEDRLTAVTSVITLQEVLVLPYRDGLTELTDQYERLLTEDEKIEYVPLLDEEAAKLVAKLKAVNKKLKTLDAQHLALAIQAKCDGFLTNDSELKRIAELPENFKIVLLSELQAELDRINQIQINLE